MDVDVDNRRLSLSHKHIEENPWEVFETVFTIDSVHKGTITQVLDKGAVVSLPYGVEGFAPNRHLKKQDGGNAKAEEQLDFKVIEFNKDQRKIVVSHTRTFDDMVRDEKDGGGGKRTDKRVDSNETKKAVKKLKDANEKSTLGDIEALSQLKTDLAEKEKKDEAGS